MTEQTLCMARGIIPGLKKFAALIPALAAIATPRHHAMLGDFRSLCERAAAVSPECSDAELESVWNGFLEFTARYGVFKPTNEMEN